MNKSLPQLYQQAKDLPVKPGVYLMKNSKAQVIYVGKAKVLPNRVKTYFQPKYPKSIKTTKLVSEIKAFDFITVTSEKEALLLEYNLIQKHKPKYNIKLKNTQGYPYLQIDLNHSFPKLEITYRPIKDSKHHTFGPYPNIKQLYQTKDFLNKSLQLRTCSDRELLNRSRPCLLFQLGQCSAPCMNKDKENYGLQIKKLIKILSGNNQILKEMKDEMNDLAKAENFEQAAKVRDLIEFFKKQKSVVSTIKTGQEIHLAYSEQQHTVMVGLLEVNDGKVENLQKVTLENFEQEEINIFLEKNLLKLLQLMDKPFKTLALPFDPSTDSVSLVKEQTGTEVKKIVNKDYEQLIQDNLYQEETLSNDQLEQIKQELNLDFIPYKIECMDISNWQDSYAVGSKVVMIEGVLDKSEYRKYKMKTEGQNDFAMMKELVLRRFQHPEESFPDLLVIDGGVLQLQKAQEALDELKIQGVTAVGLAKDKVKSDFTNEEIIRSGERIVKLNGEEYLLNSKMQAHKIVKLRDEAHRFALKYHRQLRSKNQLISGIKKEKDKK